LNTYTGNAAGGPLGSVVTISVPADVTDPLNAATFNAATQQLADYVEAIRPRIRSGAILRLEWSNVTHQTGTFASTNTPVLLVPTGTNSVFATIGTDVTATASPHKLTANAAGKYRLWVAKGMVNATVNLVRMSFMKNAGTTLTADQDIGAILQNSATSPTQLMSEAYLTLAANDFIQLAIYGTSGQTYDVIPQATTGNPIQWFGMERIA
jgi:hypothetical protein